MFGVRPSSQRTGPRRLSRRRLGIAAAGLAVVAASGAGVAIAAGSASPPSNSVSPGRGINEYGMTAAYYQGKKVSFTYAKGFFCDTSVAAAASSKCEGGATFNTPPAKQYDPLYITVPLGFSRPMNMMQCPATLVCVDHPGTIDLSRLEPALKPLYPTLTNAQLTAALKNFAVPGHDHFITDLNNNKPEWWDVKIVGVTSPSVYQNIVNHKSYAYIAQLIKAKNKSVTGVIPTNLFLYFGV